MVKSLSLYLVFNFFNTDIVSDFTLLLHAWTYLKSISLDLECRKGLQHTNKKYMASSTLSWCLEMIGGKGILRMVFWCSGFFLIDLPCIMGIWGPYMAYALPKSSVVIEQLLI